MYSFETFHHRLILSQSSPGESRFDVIWLHNDKEIKPSADFASRVEGDDHILDIAEVFPEDAGIYTCEAFNDAGEGFSSCTILVRLPTAEAKGPAVVTFPRSTTTAAGNKVAFSVETEGDVDKGKAKE